MCFFSKGKTDCKCPVLKLQKSGIGINDNLILLRIFIISIKMRINCTLNLASKYFFHLDASYLYRYMSIVCVIYVEQIYVCFVSWRRSFSLSSLISYYIVTDICYRQWYTYSNSRWKSSILPPFHRAPSATLNLNDYRSMMMIINHCEWWLNFEVFATALATRIEEMYLPTFYIIFRSGLWRYK